MGDTFLAGVMLAKIGIIVISYKYREYLRPRVNYYLELDL